MTIRPCLRLASRALCLNKSRPPVGWSAGRSSNWPTRVVVAIQRQLAAISLGQARALAQQAAASAGRDTQLTNSQVANSGDVYELTVVEEAGMAQQVEFTSMELAKILNDKGSVALHGILFDTAKATIKDESKAELQAVGDLLKAQAGLRLEIQGHTDSVGTPASNKTLSEARAAAVKQYLVANFSIAPDRLTTAGFGENVVNVPSPRWPDSPSPQHDTVASCKRAQPNSSPATTRATLTRLFGTSTEELFNVPSAC